MFDGGGPAVIQVQVDSKAKCERLGQEILSDQKRDFEAVFGTVKLKEAKFHCYGL
jgi:hypothetical protein